AGTNLGLALYVEGDNQPLDCGGIKIEPFKKNNIGARIFIRKADWSADAPAYRRFLWKNVERAIWGCVETLDKKQVSLDVDRLRRDLSLVEEAFLGVDLESKSRSNAPEPAETKEQVSFDETSEDEMDRIVVQYRIEGHGNGQDHDKRVAVEKILEECLSEGDLGNCDGGDIGSGTINVFCFVSDAEKAREPILQTLRNNGFLEGAVIQETVKGEDKVVWPPDYVGEFSIV
ncbi:MAG: hypothetical protein WCA22_22375, partial [Candidatus Binatus sp.]